MEKLFITSGPEFFGGKGCLSILENGSLDDDTELIVRLIPNAAFE